MPVPRRSDGGFPHARAGSRRAACLSPCLALATRLGLFVLTLPLLAPAPVAAQSFGQWWWDGSLGLGQRGNENLRDGETVTSFDEQQLQLSLGLNGYVLHPLLGNFRVGLDLFFSQLENGKSLESDRLGASVDLNLFPRGAYPFRLHYRRTRFEFTRIGEGPLLPLSQRPDRSSVLEGRVRIRRGALRGTLVGADHTTLTYQDPGVRDQFFNREFVDWGRQLGTLNHHLRLEHQERNFSFSNLEVEDLNLLFDQQGTLSEVWGWQLSGGSILRKLSVVGGNDGETQDYRLRNLLFRPMASGRDRFDLETRLGLRQNDPGSSTETYAVRASYRWRPKPGWEVAPFTELAFQSGETLDSRSPRLGAVASWSRSGERVDTLLSSRVSYGTIRRSNSVELADESVLGLSLAGSIAHGRSEGLRKELDVEVNRNELSLSRDPIPELPDLGLAFDRLTTQDSQRLRLTLSHRWRRSLVSSWGEWNRQEASTLQADEGFFSETFSGNLQLSTGRLNFRLGSGETRVEEGLLPEQRIRFDTISGGWRPSRALRLRAAYRKDTRMLVLTPDLDVERVEAGLSLMIGRVTLDATAYENRERLTGGTETTFRGFQWSVRRTFAGWLPVVSGSQRRGVIR